MSEPAKRPYNVLFLARPHDSVDRMALKAGLHEIGASEGSTDWSLERADAD